MTSFDYSIVIPYYNKPYEIRLILKAFTRQDYPKDRFEIVIVDDGSDEPLHDLVETYKEQLHINYQPLGRIGIRGLVRNTGAEKASADRLLFLDSDMIPERDFISQFDRALEENKNRVVMGWRYCLFDYEKEYIDEEVIENNFEILSSQVGLPDGRIIAVEHQQRTGRSTQGNWRQLHSHSFAMYKDLFFSVNGFDEEFSRNWGAEDVELGYRLEKAGAEIIFNTKALSYHIEHPVNTDTQITSLNENYRIFLKKHPHWDVELFSKEYETLFPEQEEVVRRIKKGLFSLDEKSLPSDIEKSLPDNTLLIGIDAPSLITSDKVTAAFYPESAIDSSKVHNIIGFNTPFEDASYACVLVSAYYEKVNKGMFILLLKELQRLAPQVIVCDECNQEEVLEALTAGKNIVPAEKPRVLFGLDNQIHHTYLTYAYRSLALASQKRGIEVGIQLMSDPWFSIDVNDGFLRHGQEYEVAQIDAFRKHELRFLGDTLPCVLDSFAAEFFGHTRNARIMWEESFGNNFGKKIARDVKHGFKVAFSKRDDDKKHLEKVLPCKELPTGIDSERIRCIAEEVKPDNKKPFTFFWTDRFTNKEACLNELLDVFIEQYKNNSDVQLILAISDNFFPVNEVDEVFQSESLFFHVSNMMKRKKVACDMYLAEVKERIAPYNNIVLLEGVYDLDDYSRHIALSDAFIHINAKREICPLVLEAVALGKPTIVPADNRYEGYIPSEHMLECDTKGVPMLYLDDAPDAFFSSRYYSYDVVLKESLQKQLAAAITMRGSSPVPISFREQFLEDFSWDNIAETFESYLQMPELQGA